METVVAEENYQQALRVGNRNQGAAGIDRMPRKHLEKKPVDREGETPEGDPHVPSPVKRVEIKKPAGAKDLGIPTVQDRFIQQTVTASDDADLGAHSASTAMGSGRAERTGRGASRAEVRAEGRTGWWTSTSRSSSTTSITTF